MTAWQDQPPLSRRQARESERGIRVGSEVEPASGLTTDGRSDVPHEGWQQSARRVSVPQGSGSETNLDGDQGIPSPSEGELMRVSSGSGRRAQPSPAGETTETHPAESSVRAEVAPDFNASDPIAGESADAILERPLTRRELRARGLGGFAPPTTQIAVIAPQPVSAPEETPSNQDGTAGDSGPAARRSSWGAPVQNSPISGDAELPKFHVVETPPLDARATGTDASGTNGSGTDASGTNALGADATGIDATETIVAELELVSELEELGAIPAQPTMWASEQAAPAAPAQTAFERMLFPSGVPVETQIAAPPADRSPTTFDLFGRENVQSNSVAEGSQAYSPPVGHWSRQAEIDDNQQVQDSTFGRDVAATSGALTTSALVLPSVPTAEDIMGPLSGTGEILITGSINLPSSIGTTGVQPARYDHSDVDALLEADDREDAEQDSAPVRAIRAVSTSTTSGDVIISMKPRKTSKLPMIIIIASSVLIVGVVVLLVLGASLGLFQ